MPPTTRGATRHFLLGRPSRPRPLLLHHQSPRVNPPPQGRRYTTHPGDPPAAPAAPPTARWLSTTKARLGRCVLFGLSRGQAAGAAAEVGGVLGREWRGLVAGREGFLVDQRRAGLMRRRVVWGEMDVMGHVNNVAYVRYAESARVNWLANYGIHHDPDNRERWNELASNKSQGVILRSITIDYKFPMTWPDHISVYHKLHALPKPTDSHFLLDAMILSELHQRPAARCLEDIVVYDYRAGAKTPLMPFMMDALTKTWQEQEAARLEAETRINQVEGWLRQLERETWDKEGSVEDMGPNP